MNERHKILRQLRVLGIDHKIADVNAYAGTKRAILLRDHYGDQLVTLELAEDYDAQLELMKRWRLT